MFGLTLKRSASPKNDGRLGRHCARLRSFELLEDRVVPAIIFTDTYEWSNMWGEVTVTVTVDDAAPGYEGQWKWNYHLDNVSFYDMPGDGLEMFTIPVKDPEGYGLDGLKLTIGNVESDRPGWEGEVGNSPARPLFTVDEYIWWGDETGLPIEIGQSANFWFTTVPTQISSGTGLTQTIVGGFAPVVIGTVAAPVAPDPLKVTIEKDEIKDDGLVSLREAIRHAHRDGATGQQRITFGAGMNGKTITLDSQLPVLTKTIFIDGVGKNITVERDATKGKFRLFYVNLGSVSTIAGLTIKGGETATFAGAIYSSGNLTLQDCVIRDNKALAGGAIYAFNGTLDIVNCDIRNNTADLPTDPGDGVGGGVWIGSLVTVVNISNTYIRNNTASFVGGGIYIAGGDPDGGIDTEITLNGASIVNNMAQNKGGGIYVEEDSGATPQLTLTGGTVIALNTLWGTGSRGGGLYLGAGHVTYNGVYFYSNIASEGHHAWLVVGTTYNEGPGGVEWD